jgi:hypothetical protein
MNGSARRWSAKNRFDYLKEKRGDFPEAVEARAKSLAFSIFPEASSEA